MALIKQIGKGGSSSKKMLRVLGTCLMCARWCGTLLEAREQQCSRASPARVQMGDKSRKENGRESSDMYINAYAIAKGFDIFAEAKMVYARYESTNRLPVFPPAKKYRERRLLTRRQAPTECCS